MRRLMSIARSWFRFDLTPEHVKTEATEHLTKQTARLSALESIRPAYSQMGGRLSDRRSSKRDR